MKPRSLVVSVNYADLLRITLPLNMRFLSECLVITSPGDQETKDVCAGVPGVRVFETDASYRYGARFNKGLSVELGFDELGRDGWLLCWDADIIFPDGMDNRLTEQNPQIGTLYGPPRVILKDPSQWTPEYDWDRACHTIDRGIPGYFQLFHASDPHIATLPWHDVTFSHAGGGDGYFESRWPRDRKVKLPFNVLHLGLRDHNWMGRAGKRADGKPVENAAENAALMKKFLGSKGWTMPCTGEAFDDHVNVPGHERKFREW